MSTATLFGYFRSSCSWRIRIALAIKGVEVNASSVHLIDDGGQQHSIAHLERNALAQVPVWQDSDIVLSQSMAILHYLEGLYPTPALIPTDLMQSAYCHQFAEMINSGIQPLQNLSVMQFLTSEHGFSKTETLKWSAYWIDRGLRALEQFAGRVSGTYCIGDKVSIADCCLFPQLYNARRFGLNMQDYPILERIEGALSQIDAFVETDPHRQPDTPPELKLDER